MYERVKLVTIASKQQHNKSIHRRFSFWYHILDARERLQPTRAPFTIHENSAFLSCMHSPHQQQSVVINKTIHSLPPHIHWDISSLKLQRTETHQLSDDDDWESQMVLKKVNADTDEYSSFSVTI